MINKQDIEFVGNQYDEARKVDKWLESEMGKLDWPDDEEKILHYSRMHDLFNTYGAVARATVMNHVKQVTSEAYRLLSEDDSWTSNPVRYKRTKRAIERIIAPALDGSFCHLSYSNDASSDWIVIHSDQTSFYVSNDDSSIKLMLTKYFGSECGDCEIVANRAIQYKNDYTLDDIITAAFERNEIKHEIEQACKEYKDRIYELYKPLLCLTYNEFKAVTKEANASF